MTEEQMTLLCGHCSKPSNVMSIEEHAGKCPHCEGSDNWYSEVMRC